MTQLNKTTEEILWELYRTLINMEDEATAAYIKSTDEISLKEWNAQRKVYIEVSKMVLDLHKQAC